MPSASKLSTPVGVDLDAIEGRYAEVDDHTVMSADVSGAVAALVAWLETGHGGEELFAPDCFVDLSLPQWRLQADTAEELLRIRKESHPMPGRVRVERVDTTDAGFVIAFEERWTDGQDWYCREQIRADVVDGRITDVSVYCTGDWDQAVQARHAAEVTLLRT